MHIIGFELWERTEARFWSEKLERWSYHYLRMWDCGSVVLGRTEGVQFCACESLNSFWTTKLRCWIDHWYNVNFRREVGFPAGSAGKESTCNVGDLGSIPGLGWSPGEGNGYPLQYSGLENSMDCIVHGVAKGQTWLRDSLIFRREIQPAMPKCR